MCMLVQPCEKHTPKIIEMESATNIQANAYYVNATNKQLTSASFSLVDAL